MRRLDLKKAPSVSETIDWARTLVLLGIEHVDDQQARETLHILLKYQTDIAKAAKELGVERPAEPFAGKREPTVIDLLGGFIQELRAAGLPVSLTREPGRHGGGAAHPDRGPGGLRCTLAATLVKNNSHWRAFETVFEVYFSLRGPQYKLKERRATPTSCGGRCRTSCARARAGATPAAMESLTPEELAQLLYQAL